jgi:hypothetical protein
MPWQRVVSVYVGATRAAGMLYSGFTMAAAVGRREVCAVDLWTCGVEGPQSFVAVGWEIWIASGFQSCSDLIEA